MGKSPVMRMLPLACWIMAQSGLFELTKTPLPIMLRVDSACTQKAFSLLQSLVAAAHNRAVGHGLVHGRLQRATALDGIAD
jgi:hypothetical protein